MVSESGTNLTRTAETTSEGYYLISSLRPKNYVLTVTAPGFREVRQDQITLLADQSLSLNVSLELGTASESVEVHAEGAMADVATAKLELRREYFNLLNHTNFLDPAATVSAAGFGGIRGANDPRIGQAAMKFTF